MSLYSSQLMQVTGTGSTCSCLTRPSAPNNQQNSNSANHGQSQNGNWCIQPRAVLCALAGQQWMKTSQAIVIVPRSAKSSLLLILLGLPAGDGSFPERSLAEEHHTPLIPQCEVCSTRSSLCLQVAHPCLLPSFTPAAYAFLTCKDSVLVCTPDLVLTTPT